MMYLEGQSSKSHGHTGSFVLTLQYYRAYDKIQDIKNTTNSISQFAETFCFSQAAILCFHFYQFNFKKGLTNYIEICMMFIYDANWNFQ